MGTFKKGENWYIDFYVEGLRRREKIGPSKSLAKEVLRKRQVEAAEGKFLPPKPKAVVTFNAMADLYWELHARHKPGAGPARYHLSRLKAASFGAKPLAKISIPDLLRYLNGVKEKSSASTANRYHAIIRSIFNRAIEWEKFAGPNPAVKVKQFRVENHRLRFLSQEEISRLLGACHARIYPAVVCALMTGMRRGEILRLSWERVDLEHKILYVLESKSGKPREIPIAGKLQAVLAFLGPKQGLVFDVPVITLRRYFDVALKQAGIRDFRFHDLRHTFASHYIMRTNDLPALQALLGHHSPVMTQRYAHLSQTHLRGGIELFDSAMDTIWTPRQFGPSGHDQKVL